MFGNKFGRHQNVECGLLCILPRPPEPEEEDYDDDPEERTAPIPLQSVNILASVVHAVAQVELTQIFVNKEEQPIEAIYYFPVDSNGGVTHFHAELEGRTIKGIVKPQDEAKEQYEKAFAEKQTAFLVDEDKPDIFKVKIGFLKPGSQVKIVIGYVTEVKNEKGSNAMRFFIPTTVAPRYISPTESDEKSLDLKNMKFSEKSPAPLSIRVNVSLQGGIKNIESPTHEVKVVEKATIPEKTNWTRGIVELTGTTTDMDRDFVLLVTPEEDHLPRLYVERLEGTTAVMSHLIPSFNLDEQKVELIFVLDRSGSMEGESINLAKKALALFLHSAPVDCYFNIVGFGDTHQSLFPESVKYDDGSLKKALAHAKSLQADLGGTEIYQPLKEIFEKNNIPGYLRQIFVLTDGEVSNTDQVIGLVKAHSHSGRLFALGIGDSSSHHLVEGLAEAGAGTSEFVTYNEKIDTKVLQQLKNAIQPSLMDVKVNWAGISEPMQVQPVEINKEKTLLGYGKPMKTVQPEPKSSYSQVPKEVPPIYDGAQLLVFGLFSTEVPSGLVISAQSPDGPLSIEMKMDDKNDLGSNGMIHKLAAIKMIRELEIQSAALGYVEETDASKSTEEFLKKEITELSVKHGVGSKYTSFVAIDTEGDTTAKDNWVMQTRYVPTQIAHGWHGGGGGARRCSAPSTGGVRCARRSAPATGGVKRPKRARPLKVLALRKSGPSTGYVKRCKRACRKQLDEEDEKEDESDEDEMEDDSDEDEMEDESDEDEKEDESDEDEKEDESDEDEKEDESDEDEMKDDSSLGSKDPLHLIVSTQSFDGSFPLNENFATAVGTTLATLENEAKTKGWESGSFATAVAIAYFVQKLADAAESWELVVAKAKKWLMKNFPQNHAEIFDGGAAFVAGLK